MQIPEGEGMVLGWDWETAISWVLSLIMVKITRNCEEWKSKTETALFWIRKHSEISTRKQMRLFVLFVQAIVVVAIGVAHAAHVGKEDEVTNFLSRSRGSLAPSSWYFCFLLFLWSTLWDDDVSNRPLDHGDTARSKMSQGAGLSADVDSSDIDFIVNDQLSNMQWLYTGGNHSEWIYSIRGDAIKGFVVNKLE